MRRRDTGATVELLCGGVEVARWALVGGDGPDLALVNRLARLQLAAGRLGCSIRLHGASAPLVELLDLLGLREVMTGVASDAGRGPGSAGRQERRQPEDGEEVGVEEAVVPDDPVA